MNGLDRWDLALLAGAVLAAVWRLVVLMRARRNQLIADVQQQLDQQQSAKKKADEKEAA